MLLQAPGAKFLIRFSFLSCRGKPRLGMVRGDDVAGRIVARRLRTTAGDEVGVMDRTNDDLTRPMRV